MPRRSTPTALALLVAVVPVIVTSATAQEPQEGPSATEEPAQEPAQPEGQSVALPEEPPVAPVEALPATQVEALDAARPLTEAKRKPAQDPPVVSFKPGKGLKVVSGDGRYALSTGVRVQFLYTLEADPGDAGPELAHSFEVRRARVNFGGHLFGPHNTFKIQLAFSPKDEGLKNGVLSLSPLLDAYMELDHLRDFTVRFGQYKVSYDLQTIRSSGALAFVDRTIANGEFRLDRDIGFQFSSDDIGGAGYVRYMASLMIGEGHSANTLSDFGMLYVMRFEVFPLGIFDDYMSEPDLDRSSRVRLALGGAYAFLDEAKGDRGIRGSRPADGGTTDTHNVTADLSLRVSGFSLESAFYWRQGSRNPGPLVDEAGDPLLDDDGDPLTVEPPRDGYGVHAQASVLMPQVPVELAVQYAHVAGLGTETSLSEESTLGGALGWFVQGHNYKIQADYQHLWDSAGLAAGSDQVRVQLQANL